jgi:hypothetical protein
MCSFPRVRDHVSHTYKGSTILLMYTCGYFPSFQFKNVSEADYDSEMCVFLCQDEGNYPKTYISLMTHLLQKSLD